MKECYEDSGARLSASCKELDHSPVLLIRNRELVISVCDSRRNSQHSIPDFGAEIDRLSQYQSGAKL